MAGFPCGKQLFVCLLVFEACRPLRTQSCFFFSHENLEASLGSESLEMAGRWEAFSFTAGARPLNSSPSLKGIGRSDVSERECESVEVAMEEFFYIFFYLPCARPFWRNHPDSPNPSHPLLKPLTPSQWPRASNRSRTSRSTMKSDN